MKPSAKEAILIEIKKIENDNIKSILSCCAGNVNECGLRILVDYIVVLEKERGNGKK
jgi:hypothetical protein